MSSPLDNQPDVVLSCKFDPLLDVLGACGINHIDRISLATAWIGRDRKASVVVEIVADGTDGVVGMECRRHPGSGHSGAKCGVECWLAFVTDSAWWWRFEETSG
jgi:hypothetical protein